MLNSPIVRLVSLVLLAAVLVTFGVLTATAGTTVESQIAAISGQIDKSVDAGDKVKAFARAKLIPIMTNAVIVKEVKAQNAVGATLDDIKKIDDEWINAEDELPIHTEKMGNACAVELKKLVTQLTALTEVFVMDNQGANVGQNTLTSDYWQGDEPKWELSYNAGKGGVDISKTKLDKSTNAVDQKISLPILDENGTAIGAICIGINPDAL
jgi:hypothetical protein